jgi:hypothetical protein
LFEINNNSNIKYDIEIVAPCVADPVLIYGILAFAVSVSVPLPAREKYRA